MEAVGPYLLAAKVPRDDKKLEPHSGFSLYSFCFVEAFFVGWCPYKFHGLQLIPVLMVWLFVGVNDIIMRQVLSPYRRFLWQRIYVA